MIAIFSRGKKLARYIKATEQDKLFYLKILYHLIDSKRILFDSSIAINVDTDTFFFTIGSFVKKNVLFII